MKTKLDVNQIKTALRPVFRIYNVKTAVLFGSYAKGTADEKSDVDLYVDSGLTGLRFIGLIESVREALNDKDVDMLDKTHIDAGSRVSDEIKRTGIVIYEG
ncbi:nucleotidyltransferase domain-containing protein [Candidatus Saccharibacteria bacterium]|nr:nucleotidyltransferase domain-containing protein [Candidatus Saccharibacteria bacterium]